MHSLLAQKNTLLFDLDGTLVDSVYDIAPALNLALAEFDLGQLSLDQVRSFIGRGSEVLVRLAIDALSSDQVPPLQPVHARFIQAYSQNLSSHTQVLGGAIEFLSAMQHSGKSMACVTNKPEALAVQLLDRLQMSTFFSAVIGGDTASAKKPDPAPLLLALERLGRPQDDALMFGDSIYDLKAAQAARVPCFVISGGYNRGEPVPLSLPNIAFDDYRELLT